MTQGCLKRRNLFLYSTNQRSIFDLDQKHVLWFPGLEPEEDVREGGGLLRVHGARVDASGILGGKHPRETERWKVKKHFQKLWYLFLLKVSSRSKTMEGEKQTDHYYTFSSLSLKCSSTNSCCCRLVNTLTGESLHCCNIGRTVTRVAVLCVCGKILTIRPQVETTLALQALISFGIQRAR